MLNQATVDRLREMRLNGMAEALVEQMGQPDIGELSFEERLGLLVDHEWTSRRNHRLARLLREAKLRLPACLEDIDYVKPRGLDRSLIRHLGSCQWVQAHQAVLVTGPTGVGKTYIACALGNAACRHGHSTRYYRLARLLTELEMARADGSYPQTLRKLARIQVLILDEWGLAPLSPDQTRQLLEVIDDRVELSSTIVASQLPIAEWHGTMADPTAADAILDRLVHRAHKLVLKGESMRKAPSSTSDVPQSP